MSNIYNNRDAEPYPIPGGASDHPLGSMGYVACASEIMQQSRDFGFHFDYVVHCTGSGSTQAGLVAGFAALETETRVIGVSDDNEVEIKKARVLRLANETLETLDLPQRVDPGDIEIITATTAPYGVVSTEDVLQGIHLLARSEGFDGRSGLRGKGGPSVMLNLAEQGRFAPDRRVLLMHLGGTLAIHAYASQFPPVEFTRFEA